MTRGTSFRSVRRSRRPRRMIAAYVSRWRFASRIVVAIPLPVAVRRWAALDHRSSANLYGFLAEHFTNLAEQEED